MDLHNHFSGTKSYFHNFLRFLNPVFKTWGFQFSNFWTKSGYLKDKKTENMEHIKFYQKTFKNESKKKREKRIQGVMFLRQQPWLFVDILLKICILHLIVKLKAHCVQKKALYFWKIYHISRKILVPRVLFDVLLSVSFRCFSLVFAVSQYLKSSHQSLS